MHHRPLTTLEILAVCWLGTMAGFFFAFAIDVVPAMAQLDGSSYIATQQAINRVVRNAVFGAAYFGSAVLPFAAAGLALWAKQRRRGLLWLVIAAVYFGAVFWVTRSINVPINNELASWQASAPPAHWQQARDTWNEANGVRALASMLCFCAAVVLVALPKGPRNGQGPDRR